MKDRMETLIELAMNIAEEVNKNGGYSIRILSTERLDPQYFKDLDIILSRIYHIEKYPLDDAWMFVSSEKKSVKKQIEEICENMKEEFKNFPPEDIDLMVEFIKLRMPEK